MNRNEVLILAKKKYGLYPTYMEINYEQKSKILG